MSTRDELLQQYLAPYFPGILGEKTKCRSMIKDAYGVYIKEANLLTTALDAGVPVALLDKAGKSGFQHESARLIRYLEDAFSLNPDSAQWSVRTWAWIMGIQPDGMPVNIAPSSPAVAPKKRGRNSIGMAFIALPPGNFFMGSPLNESGRDNDEYRHEVTLTKAFHLGVYPVTQAEYAKVMGENPSRYKDKHRHPVDGVSYLDAADFCRRLSELPEEKSARRLYRLPTEAEWEYACRAGSTSAYCWGDEPGFLGDYGWYENNSGKQSHPVGEKKPNAWGLYDMHGGVWEWCADLYAEYPTQPVSDPQSVLSQTDGPSAKNYWSHRGGGWWSSAGNCRSAYRSRRHLSIADSNLGFRVVVVQAPAIGTSPGLQSRSQVATSSPLPKDPARPLSVPRKPQPVQIPPVARKFPPTRQLDLGGGVQLELILIHPGTFLMGSPASEAERDSDETQHDVTLTQPFYLGKYPVTQAQWKAVLGNNPSHFQGDYLPVEMVSWDDVQIFCQMVRNKTGQAVGLPTEAQWEYCCRAGTSTPFHFGSVLNGAQANCGGNYPYGTKKGPYLKKTSPVGSYLANSWGLHDMHGNVWEWCQDWYGEYPRGKIKDPQGSSNGEPRVLRGGSWSDCASFCRAGKRDRGSPGNRNGICGIRLLLPLDFV